MESRPKIVAIVGQTASGKTDLAILLAKKFDGEIICADSRTIYKSMDIGTAKPSTEQQKVVRHHMLDIVDPNQRYSVAQFKSDALKVVSGIVSRGKLPIIVGGSGLYINALAYDYDLDRNDVRNVDSSLNLEELQNLAQDLDLSVTSQTMKNKQHLVRFIETDGVRNRKMLSDFLLLGLIVEPDLLSQRIKKRVNEMYDKGLVDEVRNVVKMWGDKATGLSAPGYISVTRYLKGDVSLEESKLDFINRDIKLAKKQKTWFKKNKDIHWVKDFSEAEQLITDYLIQ